MKKSARQLLNECSYALGEAKVNTEIAMRAEENKVLKDMLSEDWILFNDLIKDISAYLKQQTDKKAIGK